MTATRRPFGGAACGAVPRARRLCPSRSAAAADRDRRRALVLEDARALAQDLDRADARAGAAEDVLLEDRPQRLRVLPRDLRDEAGDVDAGGTGDRARRGGVGPAALEAAVRLDERLGWRERRPQLVEAELWLRRCAHTASVRARGCIAIRACT